MDMISGCVHEVLDLPIMDIQPVGRVNRSFLHRWTEGK